MFYKPKEFYEQDIRYKGHQKKHLIKNFYIYSLWLGVFSINEKNI